MDFIHYLQKAIDYMEEHILESITYEDVAKHVCMSKYHFHRIFALATGISANEYLRKRKLSMAGQDISLSNRKVIDIAFKYGYSCPESFTKAFKRFHGVTPKVARHSGIKLKSFNRLLVKVNFEGGTILDYRIEEREEFCLLTKVREFRNEIISEEDNTEIPEFWKECGGNNTFEVLKENSDVHDIYGVCSSISKECKSFKYGIGMIYNGSDVPDGYILWDVKPTLWAVFKCIGETPDCIGDTWDRIFKEFLPCSTYTMLDDTDFELYPSDSKNEYLCEIWIPVEKKTEA